MSSLSHLDFDGPFMRYKWSIVIVILPSSSDGMMVQVLDPGSGVTDGLRLQWQVATGLHRSEHHLSEVLNLWTHEISNLELALFSRHLFAKKSLRFKKFCDQSKSSFLNFALLVDSKSKNCFFYCKAKRSRSAERFNQNWLNLMLYCEAATAEAPAAKRWRDGGQQSTVFFWRNVLMGPTSWRWNRGTASDCNFSFDALAFSGLSVRLFLPTYSVFSRWKKSEVERERLKTSDEPRLSDGGFQDFSRASNLGLKFSSVFWRAQFRPCLGLEKLM